MLSFTLLGQPVLTKNGVPLANFRSQKEAALLIYLAHTGEPHSRSFLGDLLWQSSSTKQSLANLRTALARLRKKVGAALLITRQTVALTPENRQQVDSVTLLQTLANLIEIDTAEKAAALQNALETYRGPFLADFYLSNAPHFNDWVALTREHIHRQVITAYRQLGIYIRSAEDAAYGMAVAQRWLQVDGLDEAAHTLLIQLLLKTDQVDKAVTHYEMCVALLQEELGIAPPAEMTALVQNARQKRLVTVPRTTAVRHNLPPAYDQFFGRKAVQDEIHVRLDQPWCRLITIVGLGGVGKTRLATTIARSRLSQYADGVWLVDLANIEPDDDDMVEAIAVEIATSLDMRLTGAATPAEQVIEHLKHKQTLLLLDNFEHVLAGVQIVLDIVQQCEHVQLLATSREALRLRAEWTITLTGLSYPASDTDELASDAVELFVARRAQQLRRAISADNLAAIRQICRLVAGLPLAIELAAALTRQATAREVAESLRDGFGVLRPTLRDVPERHRGLHVVFEMSWRTLSPELQERLARLAVFRGGFTGTAVQQIADANADHLAVLIEKSLLNHHAETERYSLHPVIRAYAAEKRAPTDPTPQKHAHYYLSLLAHHTEPLQKDRPQDSMSVLEPDIDNVRRAWQNALDQQAHELLYDALSSLSTYYQLRGLAREGETIMKATLSAAGKWGGKGVALAIGAGLERARFQNRLGQYRLASKTLKSTLKLAAQSGNQWAEGIGHVWWGESLWRLGEYETAKEKLNHALALAQKIASTRLVGWCHHHLGIINDIQGSYKNALEHLEEACKAWQTLNDTNKLSVSYNSIGLVYKNLGDMAAARQTMERALEICVEQGNRYLQAMLLNNLSSIYMREGDYFGAQYYLQLGLELAIASGSLHSQIDLHINLGINYNRMGEEGNLAIENLERGTRLAEKIGNRYSMAVALVSMANIKKEQGDLQDAENLYHKTLEIALQDGLKSHELQALIGLTELTMNYDLDKAKQYSGRVKALAEEVGDPMYLERVETLFQNLNL